jgi:hypothetical protein
MIPGSRIKKSGLSKKSKNKKMYFFNVVTSGKDISKCLYEYLVIDTCYKKEV